VREIKNPARLLSKVTRYFTLFRTRA
jgi:hypothetical protein